ncbi:MAG: hypothetical protein IMZ53_07700 [Thermoplasmata archaeon]|nr:hypothetical protein [Thermoplasmata archaeon]
MNADTVLINHNSTIHVFNTSSFNRTTLKVTTPICQLHSIEKRFSTAFYLNFTDGWFFKETVVMKLVISGGSKWDIIAMNVKRPFQVKSFSIQ